MGSGQRTLGLDLVGLAQDPRTQRKPWGETRVEAGKCIALLPAGTQGPVLGVPKSPAIIELCLSFCAVSQCHCLGLRKYACR